MLNLCWQRGQRKRMGIFGLRLFWTRSECLGTVVGFDLADGEGADDEEEVDH